MSLFDGLFNNANNYVKIGALSNPEFVLQNKKLAVLESDLARIKMEWQTLYNQLVLEASREYGVNPNYIIVRANGDIEILKAYAPQV